jgi:hypothetical protein
VKSCPCLYGSRTLIQCAFLKIHSLPEESHVDTISITSVLQIATVSFMCVFVKMFSTTKDDITTAFTGVGAALNIRSTVFLNIVVIIITFGGQSVERQQQICKYT